MKTIGVNSVLESLEEQANFILVAIDDVERGEITSARRLVRIAANELSKVADELINQEQDRHENNTTIPDRRNNI